MAINQLSTSNTFTQWLTATSSLITVANRLTDNADGGLIANSSIFVQGTGSSLNVRTLANINTLRANTANIGNTNFSGSNVTIQLDLAVNRNISSPKIYADQLYSGGYSFLDLAQKFPFAYNHANSAFIKANSGFGHANASFNQANAAFDVANTSSLRTDLAFNQANSGFIKANSSFLHANAGFNQANASFNHANSGFIQANASFIHANASFANANGAFAKSNAAYDHANSSFTQANASFIHANSGFIQANASFNHANASFIHANSGFIQVNSSFNHANASFANANGAFAKSNAAFIVANSGFIQANASFNHANAGFNQANLSFNHANASFNHANSGFTQANSAFFHANAAFITANAASIRANNSLDANNGGTVTSNVVVRSDGGIRVEVGAALDAIAIRGGTTGTSYYSATILPASLTGNVTAIIPNENFTIGFRNIPAVSGEKTSNYALTVNDVGKFVKVGTGGSITIPDATFSEGDVVTIFNNTSGDITITCSITNAFVAAFNTDVASMQLSTRGIATIIFTSSTSCVVVGNVS